MSQENVETVRHSFERYAATGNVLADIATAPDFVWDMSKFRGWPEQQTYEGVEGARSFMRAWLETWDEWELDAEAFHDAGDKVVAIMRQRGNAKSSGLPVDMAFGQVWTLRDGIALRMEMYADPSEASKPPGCPSKTLPPTPELAGYCAAMSQENVEIVRRAGQRQTIIRVRP